MPRKLFLICAATCLCGALATAEQGGKTQAIRAASEKPGRIGTVVGVDGEGMRLTLKSAGGEETFKLDPSVRIMRAVSLADLSAGDYLHGILSRTSGDGLIRRGLVNADRARREGGASRKTPAGSTHVAGRIVSVDYKMRLVTIESGDKRETVGVAERARFNAFVGIDSLKPGEEVILLAQGPAADAPVKTVIVRTPVLDRR